MLLVSNTFRRGADVLVGPARTERERWLSLFGAFVGGILGAGVGMAHRAHGIETDSLWRVYPPPVEPFLFLPLSAGVLVGLRFTVDVIRPRRMTWRRVVGLGVAFYAVTAFWLAGVVLFGSALTSEWQTLRELVWSLAWASVMTIPMAVGGMLFPGLLAAPFLAPTVATFIGILRAVSYHLGDQ